VFQPCEHHRVEDRVELGTVRAHPGPDGRLPLPGAAARAFAAGRVNPLFRRCQLRQLRRRLRRRRADHRVGEGPLHREDRRRQDGLRSHQSPLV